MVLAEPYTIEINGRAWEIDITEESVTKGQTVDIKFKAY